MELVDVNKVYELIINNKHILRMYIYKWLYYNYSISYQEANDVILLAMMRCPCYTKFCLKNKKLSKILYLKTAIIRYLAYEEGNLKAKKRRNENIRDKEVKLLDSEDLITIYDTRENKELDTSSIDKYLFNKSLKKVIDNGTCNEDNKEAIYLKLTTDLRSQDVDRLINKCRGYTSNAFRKFIAKDKNIKRIIEAFSD